MIDGADPDFEIVEEGYGPSEGERVYMVGANSGLTSGVVQQSCVDFTVGFLAELRCQFAAD